MELQRAQALKEEQRRQEEREKARFRQAEERSINELAAKEADLRIQAIEARLQEPKAESACLDKAEILLSENANTQYEEGKRRVSAEADKKVEEKIKQLARERMTATENLIVVFLFLGGIIGFFSAWWLGLGSWVLWLVYLSKVTGRYESQIKSEMGMK